MRKLKLFLSILIIYFVVDVAYQVAYGMNNIRSIYDAAGISPIMNETPAYLATIPLFFVVMAFVLLQVVVEPAIEKRSAGLAFFNGALVGVGSYGTLAVVLLWQIKGFPVSAGFAILLEGLLFPTIASGATVWWALRSKPDEQ